MAALVYAGDLNDKLARQVIEGVLAGEGDPDTVVEKRGLKVVSDEGALGAAVDEAIAGNPRSPTRSAAARSPPSARSWVPS